MTYFHTYILSYIHTFIHTYFHTYILSYIHTFIHTYFHTYLHTDQPSHRVSYKLNKKCLDWVSIIHSLNGIYNVFTCKEVQPIGNSFIQVQDITGRYSKILTRFSLKRPLKLEGRIFMQGIFFQSDKIYCCLASQN